MRLVRNNLVICELTRNTQSPNLLTSSAQVPVSSFNAIRQAEYGAGYAGHWDRAAVKHLVRGPCYILSTFLIHDENHVRKYH